MRIVSLAPAATEIACALGLADALVGVSHECDHPPEIAGKPAVTRARIDASAPSAAIDRAVAELAAAGEPTTSILLDRLVALEPDVVLVQEQCGVCAVTGDVFHRAWAEAGRAAPRIVALRADRLEGIFEDIVRVGEALGAAPQAREVVATARQRIETARARAARGRSRPRTVVLEWLDPPIVAGHWVPELVEAGGGRPVASRPGAGGVRTDWEALAAERPDVLILSPCGFSLERTRAEVPALVQRPEWPQLPAVRNGRVYAVDGNAFLARPGPRIVEAAEIVAGLVQPGYCGSFLPEQGWERIPEA